MRIHRAVLATALVAATTGLTGVAHAWVTPTGPTCSLVANQDPNPEAPPGAFLGLVQAGPLAAAGTTMSVTCTVQVGGSGLHTDPDVASAWAGPSANAVTLAPTFVAYVNPGQQVWVCTHVHQVDSLNVPADLYWDDASQSWTVLALGATCDAVTTPSSAVTGGIVVYHYGSTNPGIFVAVPFGVLANPSLWTCTQPSYVASQPFVVGCTPVTSTVVWTCDLVAVSAITLSSSGTVRASADCNGGAPEAQTSTVSGVGGVDDDIATPAGLPATTFTCTLDDGATAGPAPDYNAVCFDPGLASVR